MIVPHLRLPCPVEAVRLQADGHAGGGRPFFQPGQDVRLIGKEALPLRPDLFLRQKQPDDVLEFKPVPMSLHDQPHTVAPPFLRIGRREGAALYK